MHTRPPARLRGAAHRSYWLKSRKRNGCLILHTPPAATTNPTHPIPILAPSQLTAPRHVALTRVRELKVRFSSSMSRLPSPHFLSARRRYRRRWTKLRRATPRWSTRHPPPPSLPCTPDHSSALHAHFPVITARAPDCGSEKRPPSSLDSTVPCPAVSSLVNALFLQIPTPLLPGFLFPDSLTRISAEIISLAPSVLPAQTMTHTFR